MVLQTQFHLKPRNWRQTLQDAHPADPAIVEEWSHVMKLKDCADLSTLFAHNLDDLKVWWCLILSALSTHSWRTLRNHRGPFARLALIAKGRELSWQRCVRKVSKVIQSRRSWCVVRRTLLLRQIMLIMWITGLPYSVPSRFWKIKQDQANATFAEETPNDRIISPSCCERGMYIPNELYRWNQILLQCKCLTFSGWLLQKDYTKLDSAYEFMDTNTHKWSLLLPKVLHKTNWPRNCLHTNIGSDSDEPLHLSHQIGLFESCRVCLCSQTDWLKT